MVLIPPHAEVVKNKVASTEQMIEEAGVLEDATTLVLRQQFGELGYEINILTIDEINADPNLQQMVRNFNERYDADLAQVLKKPKDIRQRRFSLGDEARILAARLNADAIVVGRIQASGATGGQKTMAVLFGGSMGHAALNIGIVAGDNGDLEGFFRDIDPGLSPDKIANEPVETMAKVSKKVLKDYPALEEMMKIRRSWPQNTDRKVPEAELSDDDVLSDLESLFDDEPEVGDADTADTADIADTADAEAEDPLTE